MSSNKTIGLVLAIAGAVIAIIGLAIILMDTSVDDMVAYALIGVGVVVAVIGIIFMYFVGDASMGSKSGASKEKASKPKSGSKSSGKNRADSVNLGDSQLAKAIKYGAAKTDAKVAAGKMTDAEADAYVARLMAYAPKIGTKEADAAMVGVSQIIGVIAGA